ncbi:MAG: LLM class flavin-dependent oxidoreductase [Acidimicrobiales bacterium]|nr:LLM class flavin-dependent oxidoreductase [Acidimicrobiales bacterium]
MQLGLSTFGTGPNTGPADTLALAIEAERHGFDRFMLVERVLTNASIAQCAAIGAATTRIGVGTGIANVYLRHPEMLALAAAVAAAVSGGRFVLGLGPNNQASVERAGFAWRGGREALLDTTTAVRAVLDGTAGRAPACRHPVPIVWAAVAMETAELAAAQADGVMLYLATDERIARVLARVDAAARAAGRAGAVVERSLLLPTFLHDDLGAARAAARGFLGFYAGLAHYRTLFARSGFPVGADGSLSDELLDAVVALGPADAIRDRLERLAALGLSHVDLAPLPVGGEDLPGAAARLFAALGPTGVAA